jgi:hypothetical protein
MPKMTNMASAYASSHPGMVSAEINKRSALDASYFDVRDQPEIDWFIKQSKVQI